MENLAYFFTCLWVVGLLYMIYLYKWVSKQDAGDAKMQALQDILQKVQWPF